jgi:hypothetical protein
MAMQFISRVERHVFSGGGDGVGAPIGPMHYHTDPASSTRDALPNFSSFGEARRLDVSGGDLSPAPTRYDMRGSLLLKSLSATFKNSKTRRFTDDKEAMSKPGPGNYSAYSEFAARRNAPSLDKSVSPSVETLQRLVGDKRNVPSIPTREQSYGYDRDPANPSRLTLQKPTFAVGFSGEGVDKVGPLDYSPHLPQSSSAANFSAQSTKPHQRSDSQPMMGSSALESFIDEQDGDSFAQTRNTYMIALNASRQGKQSACFESRVRRNLPSAGERERLSHPGPGEYNLPSSLRAASDGGCSSFLTSDARFRYVSGYLKFRLIHLFILSE